MPVASAANTNGSAAPSGGNGGNPAANSNAEHNTIVLEYLLKRGYHGAASALRHELEGTGSGQQQQAAGRAVPQETFTTRNLGGSGPSGQGNKRGGAGGAGGGLAGIREDPAPFRDGLMGLREFVFGSLDIHRPELLPILLPVFVHSYLDLVILSYRDQAESIFNTFSTDYGVSHPSLVRLLAACKTPPAIMEHEQAVRWRRERYIIRMTRRGWSLLLGWLQGGVVQAQGLSGAIGGHGAAASQETHERGREKMLGIINERVRVDIVDAKALAAHNRAVASGAHSASSGSNTITDGGLESELVVDATADASTAIASTSAATPVPPLKLGPMPADPKLDREVQRILSSEAARPQANGTLHLIDSSDNESKPSTSTLSPIAQSDLPPYPPSFRTVDVRREVEKVREARKRIRLGPLVDDNSPRALVSSTTDQSQARFSLPSVCMFTVHDSGDTCVIILPMQSNGADLPDFEIG
ncbi:Transcription initiation factor TFIID subunit 5 [Cystobasidiomycetes sp. EMM_F5]